jgi:hypothetical protein
VFKRVLCFGSAIFLLILFSRSFAVQVSGDIWGVWNPANNPYEVIGDLHVPPDSSLTIMPGCSIQFMGHYSLMVDSLARFTAIGTEQDSIYFFPTDTAISWYGVQLRFADTTSRFQYCSFKYRFGMSGDTVDGAIYLKGGSVDISNCSFYHNKFGRGGGAGISTSDARRIRIDSCMFIENDFYWDTVPGTELWGGAVQIEASEKSIITNSLFLRNKAGCVINWNRSEISHNVFIDNEGLSIGQYWGDTFKVEYNVICGNNAVMLPPGVMAQEVYGPIYIINNTFCNNVSSIGEDYGVVVIWDEHSFGPVYNIKNNIFWGDTIYPIINGQYYYYNYYHILFSDIRGGFTGTGNIDLDPLFVDTANGDYRLRWDSPCIDAGDPSSPPDPNGSRADMGALPPFFPPFDFYIPGDINGDSNCLGSDVTYGVRYFKGVGNPPLDSLYNDSTHNWLYAAADVNGNCEFLGSDITYLVGYFKGFNPWRRWCPQTPPY